MFTTARLRCRRWLPTDVDTVHSVYSDPAVIRFVGDGTPISQEQSQEWMAVTARNYELRGYGMFALEELSTNALVGFCGLVHPGGQPEPEVKYAFKQEHWGKGYATESVAALLDHGATAFGLRRIMATVAPGNSASQQVMRKVGARLCSERRNADGSTTLVYEWAPTGVA